MFSFWLVKSTVPFRQKDKEDTPIHLWVLLHVYKKDCSLIITTIHHEMSRNVPDGHFHVFLYFLKVNSILFTMVKIIFKSDD